VKNLLRLLRLFAAIKSINQNQHRRVLCRLHHILNNGRDALLRVRRRGSTALPTLDRVIDILRQRPARRQRRPRMVAVRKHLGRHDADHVAPLIHQRPANLVGSSRCDDRTAQRAVPTLR
jgi:hypothetical protein